MPSLDSTPVAETPEIDTKAMVKDTAIAVAKQVVVTAAVVIGTKVAVALVQKALSKKNETD